MTFEQGPLSPHDKPLPEDNERSLEKISEAIAFLRDKDNIDRDIDAYEERFLYLNGIFDMVDDVQGEEWLEGLTRRELDIFLTWIRQKRGV